MICQLRRVQPKVGRGYSRKFWLRRDSYWPPAGKLLCLQNPIRLQIRILIVYLIELTKPLLDSPLLNQPKKTNHKIPSCPRKNQRFSVPPTVCLLESFWCLPEEATNQKS